MNYISKKAKYILRSENVIGYAFIMPCLLLLIFMAILPVLLSTVVSLTDWNAMASGMSHISFIGLENYKNLFTDGEFYAALKNNVLLIFLVIPAQLFISFFLAVLINKYCYAKNFFKAVYFLPYISSTIAIAAVWMVMLQPSYGPITEMLKFKGIQNTPKWLVDMKWALPSLSGMVVWQGLGYDLIIFLAALQTVPVEMYESADIEGASFFVKIKSITLPMISPTIFFIVIYEIMGTFRIFDQISVLTDGGPGNATLVLVYYLYKQAFRSNHISYGAAITVVLFIIVFIITLIQWLLRKRWVVE